MNNRELYVLEGPDAWLGSELEKDERWQLRFDEADLRDIDAAVSFSRNNGQDWSSMTSKADFPLPILSEKLSRIAVELEHGCGLVNIKGLPVGDYDDADLNRVCYGISLNLGTPIYQNYSGELLRDITNELQDTDAVNENRLYAKDGSVFHSSRARTASNAALRFHTDRADVVGLLCVRQAEKGGLSQIASSVRVNNEIVRQRPDLARLLYEEIYRSRHGEEKNGSQMTYGIPVFGVRNGKFTSHYSRTYVEAAQELENVPRMSDKQWEALDLLAEVAQEVSMEMRLEPGDMQLLNNHVIYHARSNYEDGIDRRCLKRVWLSMPNSRALPREQAILWRNVEAGETRGGIAQA